MLRLLAAVLTNRQIAKRLVVAKGAVKTHVHSLSGKLLAANRVQAIARARELRLV